MEKTRTRHMAAALAMLVAAGMATTGCVPQQAADTQGSQPAREERQSDTQSCSSGQEQEQGQDSDGTQSSSSTGSSHSTDERFTPDTMLNSAAKPVLYLYPEEATDVSVGIADSSRITSSYPEYGDGWRVSASPDGTLVDRETGRSLYALYYEALLSENEAISDEGFVVSHDGLIPFLEERLAALGLTEREAEEMIVYWLPRMQEHDACYVRFSLTEEEQQQNALEIEPAPDHLIRIRMVWQGLDAGEAKDVASRIREQHIEPVDRNALQGFVAVECGGTEIGSNTNA